jgi:hypothetical protein
MTPEEKAREAKAALWAQMDEGKSLPQEGGDRSSQQASGDNQEQAIDAQRGEAGRDAVDTTQSQSSEADAGKAAATQEGNAEGDPYAGVPDVVRHEIAGFRAIVDQLQAQLRQANGRIGGLNSELQKVKTQRPHEGRAEVPTKDELEAARGNTQALEVLVREYPEFGAVVKAALEEQVGAIRAEISARQPQSDQAQEPVVTQAELERLRSSLVVEQRHPGWEQRVVSPAFRGWLLGQPPEVQMLAKSDSPADAVRLLDLHTNAVGSLRRQHDRLESASHLPSGRGSGGGVRTKPVDQMTKAEYWRHLDQLDAQAAGR